MKDWQRSFSSKQCNDCLPPGWTSAIIGINRIQCANLLYQYIESNWMSKLETDPTLFAKWITPITKSSASVAVTTIWLPQWNKTRSTYSYFKNNHTTWTNLIPSCPKQVWRQTKPQIASLERQLPALPPHLLTYTIWPVLFSRYWS